MAKLQIFLPDGREVTHDLPEEKTTVGRLPENMLQIEDASVSSRHAEILFENNAWFIRDIGSTNGTYLNGAKIEHALLNHGDELRFGSVVSLYTDRNDSSEHHFGAAESLAAASESRRPDNFKSSSPVEKNPVQKDIGTSVLLAAAAIGLAAIGGAVYMILQIQAPTF
jgi:pSer/pThr/pTyr-binding forkhead associated (FHA) protein